MKKRSEFKQVTVKTKCDQYCAECYEKLPTGATAYAQFYRTGKLVCSVFICSAECLAEYKSNECGKGVENLLNRLSVQFN